jgi:hypothetical protein
MPRNALNALFEGEDRGVNVVLDLNMTVEEEGLYWYDVDIDGTAITRIPFRVVYQRIGARPGS